MIIFVGDKPSSKNTDPSIPFVGTQSYKRLLDWIWRMDINITNVGIFNKDNLSTLSTSDHIFIALGNKAEEALKKHHTYRWDAENNKEVKFEAIYFKLPHPSPRNFKLNDKKYESDCLKKCKEWLKSR